MAKSGAQIAKKWASNTVNAGQAYEDGIRAVQNNPMEAAANAGDRMLAGVRKSIESGKHAANCRAVSKGRWQDAAIKKGRPRIADGVAQASPMVTAFHDQHQPIAEASSAEAKQAKANGVSGKERMMANYDRMSNFRFQRPPM
jgi:hypothetical protein